MDGLDSTAGIVALAAAGVALCALAGIGVLAARLRRVRAEQRVVLGENTEADLVAHAAGLSRRFRDLDEEVRARDEELGQRLAAAEERLDRTVSRATAIRYDAFNETSGRQSSTVALLNDLGDGVVITAILQREQARVYAKEVRGWQSELELSPEERAAVDEVRGTEGR